MQLDKYLKTSAAVLEVSKAKEIGAAKGLLDAVRVKRDEIREELDQNPQRSDILKKDVVYQIGMIAGLNWALKLPELAAQWLNHLPEQQEP